MHKQHSTPAIDCIRAAQRDFDRAARTAKAVLCICWLGAWTGRLLGALVGAADGAYYRIKLVRQRRRLRRLSNLATMAKIDLARKAGR